MYNMTFEEMLLFEKNVVYVSEDKTVNLTDVDKDI